MSTETKPFVCIHIQQRFINFTAIVTHFIIPELRQQTFIRPYGIITFYTKMNFHQVQHAAKTNCMKTDMCHFELLALVFQLLLRPFCAQTLIRRLHVVCFIRSKHPQFHSLPSEVWIYQIVCHKQLCTKIPHRYELNLIESHNFTLTEQTITCARFFVLLFICFSLGLLLSQRLSVSSQYLIPIDVLMYHCHAWMQHAGL